MPRRLRIAPGGLLYHVLNRAAGRATIFEKPGDFEAFESALAFSFKKHPIRIVGYVLMPTHFHLAIWPRRDGELSEFMRLLTVTHANRWHAHHHTTGTGPVYQGRFKSFPIQTDAHASTVLRYIDRNPLRAGLVKQADNWRWGSLHHYTSATPLPWLLPLDEWPVERRSGWVSWVNSPQTAREEQAIRDAMARGRPFGDERWTLRMTDRLKLDSAFRPRGRPKREIPGAGEKAS